MQPHQQRVVDELSQLAEKREKLSAFGAGHPIFDKLPSAEQERLTRQLSIMQQYEAVLKERIENFS